MKVLWLINMVLPSVASTIGINTSVSGGWLVDFSNRLAEDKENYQLATMTYASVEKPIDTTVNGIRNFIFPGAGKRLLFNSRQCLKDCEKVIREFNPDIIHIHGTEYAIGYSMLKIKPNVPILLTIQGVLTRIAKEYYGGLSVRQILKMGSIKDVLKFKTPFFAKKLFEKNAKREQFVIKNVKYATGRTVWDKAVMLSINPNLEYFRSNYNLREEFYSAEKWCVDKIEPHTIYAGASTYTLKGAHIIIDALNIVKKQYPKVKLWLPGCKAKEGKLIKANVYEKFLIKKIKKYELEDNVVFIGDKSAKEVSKCLQKANVCIVSSAMEGASQTICEAMMIGTPCICSYRGGMTDLLKDGESGFYYDFPEYPVLAERIKQLFRDRNLCEKFSNNTKLYAEKRHDKEKNITQLKYIYKTVIEKESKNV